MLDIHGTTRFVIVRVAQPEFSGNLASQATTTAAINYYKYQTLPNPVQIIANAERSTVDAIKPGDVYALGARNIVKASGIHSLLKHTEADPLLIWAFTEVFFINNDIYRYIRAYSNLQSKCLAKLSIDESSPEFLCLRERLKACIMNASIESNRHHYLDDLMDALPKREYDLLVSAAGRSFPLVVMAVVSFL